MGTEILILTESAHTCAPVDVRHSNDMILFGNVGKRISSFNHSVI